MKIAFFETEDWEQEIIKRELKSHELAFFNRHFEEKDVSRLQDTDILAVFIYSKITKNVINKLPNLKMIAAMSTGYDNIDVEHCRKKGILVANVPAYGENTVAEHTFALILALSRKLFPSIKRTHELQMFETDEGLRGFDLKGKIIGIIGLGNIGKHVARIAKGFEMKILACTRHPDKNLVRELGIKIVSFDSVLRNSDIISLHVPYCKETHHMVDKNAISKMKHGAILVNTARGGVVDTDALVKGLETGKIAGAALDVLEGENEIKEEKQLLHRKFRESVKRVMLNDHLLMKMNNVIITPHNAFNSKEALLRIINTTIENIIQFSKKRVKNKV
ncbi:TPA: NAD(P)-binding domain-containing protein [Candidatus Woesearchaeota archaeon]|nr:NAD(P)-binding domain-containing protein [Candidatus Woesearchaeota archaeon]